MNERMKDSNSLIRGNNTFTIRFISARSVKQRYKARFIRYKSHKGTYAAVDAYKYGLSIALLPLSKEPTPKLDCQQEESNPTPSK
jgi:hypothetical protein